MDWSNKEVLNNPNLSYTSRDYASIYKELKAAIPNLTKLYNPNTEADPGIVLIKLMAMLGDVLSFNLDNNALEVFPRTVLQTKNAQQLFRLMGYKMRWYKSARCAAYFTNSNSVPVTIGRYNTFTSYTGIKYTNLNQIEIPAGTTSEVQFNVELVQGTPKLPPLSETTSSSYAVGEWHDMYGYNIDVAASVVNNRLYLPDSKVDGTTITLIDDDDTQFADTNWQQVDNLNVVTDVGKYYEFDFDETGMPFIQLPEYWNTRYSITRFKLFYVISDGEAGEIIDNSINTIGGEKVYVQGGKNALSYLENVYIYNKASTYGYSPETPDEARKSAELYVNTIDTLVTLDDFTKAVKRITGVANALATDKETDPDGENMLSNVIKLYVIRSPGYQQNYEYGQYGSSEYYFESEEYNDDMWKSSIVTELDSYKTTKYDIQVALEKSVDWIEWTVEGSIWLRQPVPSDKNKDIMTKINDNLDYTFSPSNLAFNEAVNYVDVIDNIKSSDNLIYHVDLNSAKIQYSRIRRDTDGNPTGQSIARRWRIYNGNAEAGTGVYTNYYITGLGCDPTPGGQGDGANSPNRVLREDGSTVIGGLGELNFGSEITELEIYNDIIYTWTGEKRIETPYKIDYRYKKTPDDVGVPVIVDTTKSTIDADGNTIYEETPYYCVERLAMLLSDGLESGEYLLRNYRNAEGISMPEDATEVDSYKMVYDIYDEYNEWTGRFIDRDSGEIFILRTDTVYSTRRYYKAATGQIVDAFGSYIYDEDMNLIYDPVDQEELTGRYEQSLDVSEDNTYEFYLGQKLDGTPLTDSRGNPITAFPIKPDGFHVFIDTDRFILHDTGTGYITGSEGALAQFGTIDYSTGKVKFKLLEKPNSIKIVYYKNTVAMARYNQFDVNKFYTQPQFIRYQTANRTLG